MSQRIGRGRIIKGSTLGAEDPAAHDRIRYEQGVADAVAQGMCWPTPTLTPPLVELVLRAAEALLRTKLEEDSSAFQRLLETALREADPRQRFRVRVAPEHQPWLSKALGARVSVETEESLESADYVLLSRHGSEDGRLRVRVELLRRALMAAASAWP